MLTERKPCAISCSGSSLHDDVRGVIQINWSGQGGLLLHSNRSPALQHRRLHMSAQAQIKATKGSDSSPSTAPVALRVIDEALHLEAERSYLAVSVASRREPSACLRICHNVYILFSSCCTCAPAAVCHVSHSGQSPPRRQGWPEACTQADLICYA